jgi:energy-coupling factor transporter ATP-binding protein EcfA2
MAHLSLVKSLSDLREQHRSQDELLLEPLGLALTRGTLVEFSGPSGCGKTSLAVMLLARLTAAGEACAAVDAAGGFDAVSAAAAGVELKNLLWIRCGGDIEKAFMAADLLVQAKGFGAVWLNLSGLPERQLRLVPRTYWYRYRTRIRETPAILAVTSAEPVTGSASQRSFRLERTAAVWSGGGRFKLLRELRPDIASRKAAAAERFQGLFEMDYSGA